MKDAFGTADTEVLQKMGIDSATFIRTITGEFDKLPKVMGGAQASLDNYADSWKALKTQFGESINATGWVKDITGVFNQLKKDMAFFSGKQPAGSGGSGETEAVRMARELAEKKAATDDVERMANAKTHNENIQFWDDLNEERKAALDEQLAGEKEIAKEKEKSRADAMREYNKESYMLSATLSGDKERIAAAEERLAVEEEIARLMASGFTREEAMNPATEIVKARIDAGKTLAPTGSPVDANSYQQRGLSLGRANVPPHEQKQISLLEQIRDIMKIKQKEPTW